MIQEPGNEIRRVLCSVSFLIVLLSSISLFAETPRDSLAVEHSETRSRPATLFVMKGTVVTNLDQVKGKIIIREAKPTKIEDKFVRDEGIPRENDAPSVVEKKTENADTSEMRILPVGQNEKSLLGGSKSHAVAIAVSSAKNEQKKYVNGSLLHETNFYPYSFDIHCQKNKNQNSSFFFPKNEFLSFTQGIRPPPVV